MAIILRNGLGFQIYFSMLNDGKARQTEKKAPFTPVRSRILYMDDERHAVEVGRNLLEDFGYRVTALTSGLAALEVFCSRSQEFDLVITGMNMPWLTGVELAAEVLKIRPDLPIIICFSNEESVDSEIARKLNIREFLRKPMGIKDFLRAVRRALESGQE